MPLDATRAVSKTEAINEAFSQIGTAAGNGTRMPPSKRNTEPLAWEYFVAAHLNRLAEARKARAIKAAVAAGVMFDPEKQQLPVGSHSLVYAGDVVEIACSVSSPTVRLDGAALVTDLVEAGVKPALLKRLVARHTRENRAPHKFVGTLATP
jgi:hypothetical protein